MSAKKQIWRFTFGTGQKLAGRCQPIYGTFNDARAKMMFIHGREWAFQYSEAEWEKLKQTLPEFLIEKELPLIEA